MPAALTRPILWAGTRREYVILEACVAVGALFLTRFSLISFAFAGLVAFVIHPALVAATRWDADFLHVLTRHFLLNSSTSYLLRGMPHAFAWAPTAYHSVLTYPVVRQR